ncbi:MAG: hypothetical protein JST22_16610 [Bacteroidetes bacterium]|nr:hypothetical protein [Bacteroidota bacterium]
MLAIVSDVHLTDESTARNVDEGAFRYLSDAIVTAAQREIQELHLVLLGDIFDLVRTDYWHEEKIKLADRPWGGVLDPATGMNSDTAEVERQFNAIFERILATPGSRALMQMLRHLPEQLGRPVRITYIVGNHDRVFNNFTSLHERMRRELPGIEITFANALHAPEYGVSARHGHEWDDVCHGWRFARKTQHDSTMGLFDPEAYKVMAIGEPITAELMSGLIHHVRQQIDCVSSAEDRDFFMNLQELNNLRPIFHVFHWLAWLARDRYRKYGEIMLRSVRMSLDSLLRSTLAAKWDRIQADFLLWGDTVYQLGLLRSLVKTHISVESLSWLVSTGVNIKSAFGIFLPKSDDDDLVRGARKEFDQRIKDKRIQYVVYGHTHEARHDCFSAAVDGVVRMYINTGTYLPLIERSRDGQGYVSSNQMTMAFFYHDQEDTNQRAGDGPTLALWNGIRRKRHV